MSSRIFQGKKVKKPKKPCKIPAPNTVNHAGGRAYKLDNEEQLAKFAVTGCFGSTFYQTAESALGHILNLLPTISPEFLDKVINYSKNTGLMKDMPSFLLAWAVRNHQEFDFRPTFANTVRNTGDVLRMCKIVTSGALGFRNFGSRLRRLLTTVLLAQPDFKLMFEASNQPSVKDVINLLHPKPTSEATAEAFRYIAGDKSKVNKANLSDIAGLVLDLNQNNISFSDLSLESKAALAKNIDIRLFHNWKLTKKDWEAVAQNVNFMTALYNLNTFHKNNAFSTKTAVDKAVNNLTTGAEKAKVWPYRVFTASKNLEAGHPIKNYMGAVLKTIQNKNRDKVNLPSSIALCVDISSSMRCPITGSGHSKDSTVTCVDVAGIFAAMLRDVCEDTQIVLFNTAAQAFKHSDKDAFALAEGISKLCNGGTCCEASIMHLTRSDKRPDLVIMISDNESWAQYHNKTYSAYYNSGANSLKGLKEAWASYKKLAPKAKLVLLDLTPNITTQLLDGDSVLNLAGFNDNIIPLISAFSNGDITDFRSIIMNS